MLQTSVKFHHFGELYLRYFSTNHFQTWLLNSLGVLSSHFDGSFLTGPSQKLKTITRVSEGSIFAQPKVRG